MCRLFALAVAAAVVSCTPAQTASLDKIEKVVLEEVTSGTAVALIEQAVQAMLPGATGDAVDLAISAAITLLQDEGLIPPTSTSNALAVQGAMADKLAKRAARLP